MSSRPAPPTVGARRRSGLAGLVTRLLAARALRSVGQGLLTADFALYLHDLGWSAGTIGALLTAVLGVAVCLTALGGPVSDRFGRRRFVLGYDLLVVAGALVLAFTSSPLVVAAVAILVGLGRGGAANTPFSPAENAWLSDAVPRRRRGEIYSRATAMALVGSAAGALVGVLPRLLSAGAVQPAAYRPLFIVVALSSLASFVILHGAPEIHRPRRRQRPAARGALERRLLRRLAIVNVFNGLGIGLTGPLMAYWFALRFGMGPATIAPVMAGGFLLAAPAALLTGRLSVRHGIMRALIPVRLGALLLLVLLPLMPTFWLAAAVHVMRMAMNLGTVGARQGLNLSLVSSPRRGAAGSLSAVSTQLPRTLGPFIAGLLFGAGTLSVPFFLAAGLQGAYLYLYRRSFRAYDPGRLR